VTLQCIKEEARPSRETDKQIFIEHRASPHFPISSRYGPEIPVPRRSPSTSVRRRAGRSQNHKYVLAVGDGRGAARWVLMSEVLFDGAGSSRCQVAAGIAIQPP